MRDKPSSASSHFSAYSDCCDGDMAPMTSDLKISGGEGLEPPRIHDAENAVSARDVGRRDDHQVVWVLIKLASACLLSSHSVRRAFKASVFDRIAFCASVSSWAESSAMSVEMYQGTGPFLPKN